MNERKSIRSFLALPAPLWETVRVTAGAFAVLALVGFFVGMARPAAIDPLLDIFADAAEGLVLSGISGAALAEAIFANNLLALLMTICMGFFPFLRLPALELGLNTLLLGGFAAYYQRSGLGIAAYLAGTLPHGVTELPALVVACACGLYLCRAVSGRLLRWEGVPTVREAAGVCLRAYTRLIAPLLLVSALIESFVTPLILARFL